MTPDGSELWVTDPGVGNSIQSHIVGKIYIYDALTGAALDTVDTRGMHPTRDEPLFPKRVQFSADGRTAFIATSSFLPGAGPILVVDVATRSIDKLLFDDFLHSASAIERTIVY